MTDRLSKTEINLHRSQIINNVLTSIAAIFVGAWACYSALYVKQEKKVTEYTLKELALKTEKAPHVETKLETILEPLADGQYLLQVNVILSNHGNRETRVDLDNESLSLVPVIFNDGHPSFQNPVNLSTGRYPGSPHRVALNWIDIGASETYSLSYVHTLRTPGTYLIHFMSLNGSEPQARTDHFTSLPIKYAVGADKYITIK